MIRPALLLGAALMLPGTAAAQPAAQMVGLFIQGCMAFVGNPPALRAWAHANGLPQAPEQVTRAFLHNAAGLVFDGSAADAKLALISADTGLCAVATPVMQATDLTATLEAGLRQVGLNFRLVIQRDDQTERSIHDREYLAAGQGKGWRILEAAVRGDTSGPAMLTAGPE